MSLPLISRNPDLKKLADEGYDVAVIDGYLLLRRIPYVTAQRTVGYGVLAAPLDLNAERTIQPANHVAFWSGDFPCDKNGVPISKIQHQSEPRLIGGGLTLRHSFSSKPAGGYTDYHHKMTSYAKILSHPANALDPHATATPFPKPEEAPDDSPFVYTDTASPRAGVTAAVAKIRDERVGIIGVGGTGSYILDLVAKTPVREIRLFDADRFLQHNAFRCPGATSLDELDGGMRKVDLFAKRYGAMHRGIKPEVCYIDADNLKRLDGLTFVFISIDKGEAKRPIIQYLLSAGIPFIDVGMGIMQVDDALFGQVRITAATPTKQDHVPLRISYANTESEAYRQNIQIADLNMLNAALAVIKWKKIRGFYVDPAHKHTAVYNIDGNNIVNEDPG